MNVFLLTDVEGISAVTDIDFMDREGEKYLIARDELCHSINLAVEACFASGAETVYYLDGHGGGGNVYEERIDPRARTCTLDEWGQLLRDGKIDCQIELGAHARAGTLGGFLDHTISSKEIFSYRINGVEMSELSLHALFCGAYGVPIVACTGDETACRQAREYIPEIYVGAVKRATCRNLAVAYENADAVLADTVKRALANYCAVPAYRTELPLDVEITFYRSDMCEHALARCGETVERVGARTLRRRVEHLTSYNDLRF